MWMKQGSPCWDLHRRCFLTASNFGTVLGMNKYKTVDQFIEEMIAQQTEAEPQLSKKQIADEKRKNRNMQWGKDHEFDGVAEYAIRSGLRVAEENEVFHEGISDLPPDPKTIYFPGLVIDTNNKLACSPDGLVGAEGCIEVKCPVSGQFYTTIPPQYLAQCMGIMGITRRKWCDFIEWTKSGVRITRLAFDPAEWDSMKKDLVAFFDQFCTDGSKFIDWGANFPA
jgi:hypothetical protein